MVDKFEERWYNVASKLKGGEKQTALRTVTVGGKGEKGEKKKNSFGLSYCSNRHSGNHRDGGPGSRSIADNFNYLN